MASPSTAGSGALVAGSPSTARGVLSVAAIDGSDATYPGANLALTKPSATSVPAIDANGATLPIGTFPVKVLKNADGSIAVGCHLAHYAVRARCAAGTARSSVAPA